VNVQTVTYQEPTIQRLPLGRKPANVFNDSPQVTQDYVTVSAAPQNGGATIWGDVPDKNPDGTPALRTVTRDLDLTPRSPLKYGLIAGGIGAGVGALGGLLAASSLGLSSAVGAVGGALALGGAVGGAAAFLVRNDAVKIVWDTHQIKDHKLLGYHEYVGIGEKNGQRGYFHRFVPDVQETVIGSYQTPRTEHYNK